MLLHFEYISFAHHELKHRSHQNHYRIQKQNNTICFILKSFNDCKIYPILEEVCKKLSI